MTNLERLEAEISKLMKEGARILDNGQKADIDYAALCVDYEAWYSQGLAVVSQVTPVRLADFRQAYRAERVRKEINADTFTISDYLRCITVSRNGLPVFNHPSAFAMKMLQQIGILSGALEMSGTLLLDIRAVLRAELLDSDLAAAKELFRANHLRPAGMICGVVIEAHLQSCCVARSVKLSKKDPAIGDLNEALKASGLYDVPMWRLISRLADIRNICGHKKEREPRKDEVEDLISGTEKLIKEVG